MRGRRNGRTPELKSAKTATRYGRLELLRSCGLQIRRRKSLIVRRVRLTGASSASLPRASVRATRAEKEEISPRRCYRARFGLTAIFRREPVPAHIARLRRFEKSARIRGVLATVL